MAAAWDPGIVGGPYKQSHIRLCDWKDLYRKTENVCVPGLNCYSCPGARGACPIGSLQAVIGSWNFKMAYYVAGFLIFVGALLGRLVCGFLCPFGLIQDLLNKIPFPKKIRTFREISFCEN